MMPSPVTPAGAARAGWQLRDIAGSWGRGLHRGLHRHPWERALWPSVRRVTSSESLRTFIVFQMSSGEGLPHRLAGVQRAADARSRSRAIQDVAGPVYLGRGRFEPRSSAVSMASHQVLPCVTSF